MVKNRRGWTLAEVMIVVTILGFIVMIAPTALTHGTKIFVLSRARIELQREARAALYIITRELRQAQSNTIIIDQIVSQPYYSRIRFTKQQGTNVTIAQSGSSLILTEGTNVSNLTKNLAFVAFTFPHSDDMTIISVALTLKKQIYGTAYKALHMASEKVRVMN